MSYFKSTQSLPLLCFLFDGVDNSIIECEEKSTKYYFYYYQYLVLVKLGKEQVHMGPVAWDSVQTLSIQALPLYILYEKNKKYVIIYFFYPEISFNYADSEKDLILYLLCKCGIESFTRFFKCFIVKHHNMGNYKHIFC